MALNLNRSLTSCGAVRDAPWPERGRRGRGQRSPLRGSVPHPVPGLAAQGSPQVRGAGATVLWNDVRVTLTYASAVRGPALVIGGTGMLAGAVGGLLRGGLTTVVVSRRPPGPNAFGALDEDSGLLIPVSADYADARRFAETLGQVVARTGPFHLALLWVHTESRRHAYTAVALARGALVVEVLGSGAAAPTARPPRPPRALRHVRHRAVVLGFTGEGPRTRRLDHGRISDGVLAALRAPEGEHLHLVGRVRPWEHRP